MFKILLHVIAIFMLCTIQNVFAKDNANDILHIVISTPSELNATQKATMERFKVSLSTKLPETVSIQIIETNKLANLGSNAIFIAAGKVSLENALNNEHTRIISAFNSKETVSDVIKQFSLKPNFTAVYSDPEPARQLALAQAIFDQPDVLGILIETNRQKQKEELITLAKSLSINVRIVDYQPNNIRKGIKQLKSQKAIILLKDALSFQELAINDLIHLAYDQYTLGLIGYSSAVTKNGGIATTYSSVEDNAASVALYIKAYLETGTFPQPGYGKAYSISLNRFVANSLGLPTQSEKELRSTIDAISVGREKQ